MKVPLYVALGTALRDIKQLHLETLPMPADANYYINTNTRTQKYHAVISCMEQVSSTQKVNNRAVYTRENKPRLTLAAAYIRRERNHLYEYGLY